MSVFAALAGGRLRRNPAVGRRPAFRPGLLRQEQGALFCYTYGPKPLLARCDGVFSAFEETLQFGGALRDKMIVGDLVADAWRWAKRIPVDPGRSPGIVLFPGSRGDGSAALPFITELAGRIRELLPRSETVVALSPFPNREAERWGPGLEGGGRPHGSILKADLAVTQPGTNTLELAYSLVPE